MIKRINRSIRRGGGLLLLAFTLNICVADDLDRLGMPVFYGEKNEGYGLVIYEYQAKTEAEMQKKNEIEHEIEFLAYLRPSEDDDVIGFRTKLQPRAAKTSDGEDIYAGDGKGKKNEYSAMLARPEYRDRKSNPLEMAYVELAECLLDGPGAFVDELELDALAIVAEDREMEDFPAVVADRFVDVGHGIEIQVTAMEVKAKGLMTVILDVKRSGGKGSTIVDSLYALNKDGDVIGGGRWINELDIFAKNCKYEMALLLENEVTAAAFRVVLATEYEIVPVPIVVQKLYQ